MKTCKNCGELEEEEQKLMKAISSKPMSEIDREILIKRRQEIGEELSGR